MSETSPAPGWYPAPHANNEQRYWDGTQWSDPARNPFGAPATTTVMSKRPRGLALAALIVGIVAFLLGLLPVIGAIIALTAIALGIFALMKRQPKGISITGIVLGSIALVASIAMTAGLGAAINAGPRPAPAISAQTNVPSEENDAEPAEEPVIMATVPDVAGMTAADAYNAVAAVGLIPPDILSFTDPLAKVVSTTPAAGSEAEEGSDVVFTLEEKPKLTISQENAIGSARDYLSFSGFSRTGLIRQLEYEGFSTEDATFAVDSVGADWGAECAESAKDYLSFSSFSRQGLYDQLEYEGFLPAEIEHGLASVGY